MQLTQSRLCALCVCMCLRTFERNKRKADTETGRWTGCEYRDSSYTRGATTWKTQTNVATWFPNRHKCICTHTRTHTHIRKHICMYICLEFLLRTIILTQRAYNITVFDIFPNVQECRLNCSNDKNRVQNAAGRKHKQKVSDGKSVGKV